MVHHKAHPEGLDTIAAQATPPGRGGVGIIRISGPRVPDIARACLGRLPRPRYAHFAPFRGPEGEVLDEGIALYFPAPRSFTGEDVLELQGHGGPVVMDRLLRAVLAFGARPARPGEFTERAFLNGRIDLAQAEAIADLIDAAHEEAARCALRSLQGAFSRRIHTLVEALVELRVYVEAALDFPDEDLDLLAEGAVGERLAGIRKRLLEVREAAGQGVLLREGMTVAIAGPPNAGKSTLLNALAGRDAAIVTPIPGTTRDIVREVIHIEGLPVHLIDTAGLRESGDPIEREGMRRAYAAIEEADRVLWVVDATAPPAPPPFREKCLIVFNKADLAGPVGWREGGLALSARTGAGLDLLRSHLKEAMGYRGAGEGVFMARKRHLDALYRAGEAIDRAFLQLEAGELLAEELRRAQEALSEITGEFTTEDLLGRIFSSFCIGK